jgi:HPt (histidine-containing phosphotransfer) domain-containing protein
MATPVDPDFRARLSALSDKYAAGIPATLKAISDALSYCRNADADVGSIEKLHDLLHGVAGSAATFGFPAYGAEARRLEQELLPLQGKRPVEAAEWDLLAEQVQRFLIWAARDPKAAVVDA